MDKEKGLHKVTSKLNPSDLLQSLFQLYVERGRGERKDGWGNSRNV